MIYRIFKITILICAAFGMLNPLKEHYFYKEKNTAITQLNKQKIVNQEPPVIEEKLLSEEEIRSKEEKEIREHTGMATIDNLEHLLSYLDEETNINCLKTRWAKCFVKDEIHQCVEKDSITGKCITIDGRTKDCINYKPDPEVMQMAEYIYKLNKYDEEAAKEALGQFLVNVKDACANEEKEEVECETYASHCLPESHIKKIEKNRVFCGTHYRWCITER